MRKRNCYIFFYFYFARIITIFLFVLPNGNLTNSISIDWNNQQFELLIYTRHRYSSNSFEFNEKAIHQLKFQKKAKFADEFATLLHICYLYKAQSHTYKHIYADLIKCIYINLTELNYICTISKGKHATKHFFSSIDEILKSFLFKVEFI